MTQQECIEQALDVLEKTDPKEHAKLLDQTHTNWAASLSSVVISNHTLFKARPQGATNLTCYWTAEFFYAQALVICEAITDPQLKKQCKINARESYCDSYDACGEA